MNKYTKGKRSKRKKKNKRIKRTFFGFEFGAYLVQPD